VEEADWEQVLSPGSNLMKGLNQGGFSDFDEWVNHETMKANRSRFRRIPPSLSLSFSLSLSLSHTHMVIITIITMIIIMIIHDNNDDNE
jgi:hypothetical protein